jgi:nitrogen-specific signal transduction histidine kinase
MAKNKKPFADKIIERLSQIDTDQLKQFMQQLVRENQRLEGIFNALTEGVIVTGADHKVVLINEAARLLLGLGNRNVVSMPLQTLTRAAALLEVIQEYEDFREPIRQREVTIGGARPRSLAVTVVPIEEGDSNTHAVWVLGDRTELRRQQEERSQRVNMESLAMLTAGVAHEVKNPLNSLNIHAQLISKAAQRLAEGGGPTPTEVERLQRSSAVLLEEIARLTRVVDGFIDAVRPVQPQLQREDLNAVMASLAELIGPECSQRGIALVLDLDPDLPRLRIDRQQIAQAVLNILRNAMEAIERPDGIIRLRTTMRTDHVLIEVQDNGVGIPEEDRLRIFEPYHTTKFHGTGLGLMVVFRIIRAHRGAVGLTSEVGKGTVFSIALPVDERPVRMLAHEVQPDIADVPGEI